MDVNLTNSVDSLHHTISLLKWQFSHFQTQLPGQTDIGLLQLDSKKIKTDLAPTPKHLQDEVESLVPKVTRDRTEEVLGWLRDSFRELNKSVDDVSQFVCQI